LAYVEPEIEKKMHMLILIKGHDIFEVFPTHTSI